MKNLPNPSSIGGGRIINGTSRSTKLTHVFSILASAILQRQNTEKTLDLLSSSLHAKPSLALVTSLWQEPRFYNDSQTKFPATSAAILASLMIDTAGSIAGAYWYPDYQLLSLVSSIATMSKRPVDRSLFLKIIISKIHGEERKH